MKQKIKFKLLIILGLTITLGLLIMPNSYSAEAGLQARPGAKSLASQTAYDFFRRIRGMEKEGGTLGLKAQIDETSFLDSSKNGLDIHMAKNTEWGTAAMLAASIYGSAPSGKSDESTTGNKTGIYQMADNLWEYAIGIYSDANQHTEKIKNADPRYYDLYTSTKKEDAYKLGDATYETNGWKNAEYKGFIDNSSYRIFMRGMNGIFSVDGRAGTSNWQYLSRAVIVCGPEL